MIFCFLLLLCFTFGEEKCKFNSSLYYSKDEIFDCLNSFEV